MKVETYMVQVEDQNGNTMRARFTPRGLKSDISQRGFVRVSGKVVTGTTQFGRFYPDRDGANTQAAYEAVAQATRAAA